MKLCGAMDLHSNNNVTVLSNRLPRTPISARVAADR